MDVSANNLIELLKVAPESQLDKMTVDIINSWGESLTALEVLKVLDKCVYYSLASPLAMKALTAVLTDCLLHENLTIQDIEPLAIWRNEWNNVNG